MSRYDADSPPLRTVDDLVKQFGPDAAEAVAVFDFDGVLCGPEEDAVYRLPEAPEERAHLELIARHYGIDVAFFDTRYLRHLVLQAIMAERNILPTPGPLLELAQDFSRRKRPFFVLTARSGRAAISRALAFIDHYDVTPQEIFFVGRAPKGRQLSLVELTTGAKRIFFFEDSPRHIRNSREQAIDGLRTIQIEPSIDSMSVAEVWRDALSWFQKKHVNNRAAA